MMWSQRSVISCLQAKLTGSDDDKDNDDDNDYGNDDDM